MTLGLLLTLVLVLLDYLGKVELAWYQILIPVFIELGFYVLFWILFLAGAIAAVRK
jgi:hypothetical protein